jgi:hypothetical protein
MSLLAEIVPADIAQLEADEVTFLPPAVVVVSDDLPTDTVELLVTTRRMLSEIGPPSPCLHVVHGVETDFFAFKGIGFSRVLHSRHQATPGQLAESIIDALGCEGACCSNH